MSEFLKLRAKLKQLNRDIEAAREVETARAIDTCQALIAEFGLTAFDLGLIKTQVIATRRAAPHTFPLKTRRGPQPPRYRNPDTGETWSGFGRVPHWIVGENRDEFLIEDQQQAA
jgi:DNA-binding protein H-NS